MKILKAFLLGLIIIFIISIFTIFNYFETKLSYPPKLLINTIYNSYVFSKSLPKKINFLILGGDFRYDWLEQNQDTDTIILASLDIQKNQLKLLSLPRDLWYYPINSRINKIYQNSFDQDKPFDYIKENFSNLTSQNIDHLIILDTKVLLDFISITGPVEIDLTNGFTDEQFPNPAYIKDPQNNPNPYITISFPQGKNVIDYSNIDYFIRSRKGGDQNNGGTDSARSGRQQILIQAIFEKISQQNTLQQLDKLASIYNLYSKDIIKDISDELIISLLFRLNRNLFNLQFENISLPIAKNKQDINGVIYNPRYFGNGAWVYLPIQDDYSFIQSFIDSHLD